MGRTLEKIQTPAGARLLWPVGVKRSCDPATVPSAQLGLWPTGFQGLDGHRGGVVPQTLPDFAKLARAQLPQQLDGAALDLPLVHCVVGQAGRLRSLHLMMIIRMTIHFVQSHLLGHSRSPYRKTVTIEERDRTHRYHEQNENRMEICSRTVTVRVNWPSEGKDQEPGTRD